MVLGTRELSDMAGQGKETVMGIAEEATVFGFERHSTTQPAPRQIIHTLGRRSTKIPCWPQPSNRSIVLVNRGEEVQHGKLFRIKGSQVCRGI